MKTLKSRSTTSRKKKLAVRKLPRESIMSKSDKENSIDVMRDKRKIKFLERELHDFTMRSDPPWFSSHGKRELALQNARKQNRELKREVMRLNERVMKLVDKI